jgi:hypothetical protein
MFRSTTSVSIHILNKTCHVVVAFLFSPFCALLQLSVVLDRRFFLEQHPEIQWLFSSWTALCLQHTPHSPKDFLLKLFHELENTLDSESKERGGWRLFYDMFFMDDGPPPFEDEETLPLSSLSQTAIETSKNPHLSDKDATKIVLALFSGTNGLHSGELTAPATAFQYLRMRASSPILFTHPFHSSRVPLAGRSDAQCVNEHSVCALWW